MNSTELLTNMQYIRKFYDSCLAAARQAHSLTVFEADIISFLSNNPTLDTANHIVEYRNLPKANVSKAVDSLLHRGMLSAVRDTCDRRRIHLSLTDSAAAAAADILAAQEHFCAQLCRGLSREDVEFFLRFHSSISHNAKNALERS